MILDKFKNIVNLNNPSAEKDEPKNVELNENQNHNGPQSGEQSIGETDEKTFFDEMLGAPQYTYDEFLQVLKSPQEERGDTDDLRKHWGYPRRWKVILWDLQIQNYMNNDFNAFVDFDFGGNREECRIQRGSTVKIYAKGKTKNCLRTHVVSNVAAEQKKDMNFRNVFEYRGSYLDLENEKLRIKVWEYKQFTLNKLEGIYEEPLLSFAVGQIYNETTLYKFIKDSRVKRCRLFFQLYFQELYDFELSFLNWSFNDLLSYKYIQARSLNYLCALDKEQKRYYDGSQCTIFPKSCISKKKMNNKNLRRKDSERDNKSNISLSESHSHNSDTCNKDSNKNSSNNNKDGGSNNIGGDKVKSDKTARNLEKLFVRNLSLMQNIEENKDLSYKNLENVKLPNPRVTITLWHTPKGNEGLNLVSLEQKSIRFPTWENLGEIYFRGTLRDLDVSYLHVSALHQIKVEDMTAPKRLRIVGTCQIPLKGIVDYPYVMHELEAPTWLVEEAKYEGWEKKLEEWKLGSLEGKVVIQRVPRYRQVGDLYHLDNKHCYLIVHIYNIDQIVTVDNIKELDSYVEVSFDETSRRTRLVKKTLTPNYDSQIAIPLRFNTKNDVNYQNFSKKGFIYIDVWGKTEDIIYIGGICITPYEIFFNEKNVKRGKTKLEHIDLETDVKTNYDTVVYRGCKKLSFLHNDQRMSNIHFSIWTYPDLLNNENIKVVAPLVFNTTKNFPSKLAEKYEKLKILYIEVLRTIKAIPDNCTDVTKAKRYYNYELFNQRKEYHFLPSLLTNVKSPYCDESTNAIFHYVRCIPFVHKKDNIAFTPDFTLQLKGGNALDHSLLLCSLFLGIPVIAFVCFGTLWDNQKHAWVATFEYNEEKNYGLVKFWETTTGNVYILKRRFYNLNKLKSIEIKLSESKYKSHIRDGFLYKNGININTERIKEDTKRHIKELFKNRVTDVPIGGPSLPYKTIDLIFNNKNIYLNLQESSPLNIWYDYWKFDLWFPFSSVEYNIKPCFTLKSFSHKMENMELDRIAKELRTNIEKNINIYRASRNLSTRWNRDETLELFLQIGLELLHQLNTSRNEDALLAKVKIEDWKKALYHKVPQSHRLLGFPYHFNTYKSKFISDKLISTLAILESRDRSLCLSLAVCLYSLPGDFISAYIYIITCVKITQRELKKMEIAREKAQRKAEIKNSKKKKDKETYENGNFPTLQDIQNKDVLTPNELQDTLNDGAYDIDNINDPTSKMGGNNSEKSKEKNNERNRGKDNDAHKRYSDENDIHKPDVQNMQDEKSKKKKLRKSVDAVNLLLAIKNKNKENDEKGIHFDHSRRDSVSNRSGSLNRNVCTKNIDGVNEDINKKNEELERLQAGGDTDKNFEPSLTTGWMLKNSKKKNGGDVSSDVKGKDDEAGKNDATVDTKKKKGSKEHKKERKKDGKKKGKKEGKKEGKLEFNKLINSNNYFEREKKKLKEDIDKLEKEKEEFRRQKIMREEKEKQMLLEEKQKLEKEKELFENEKLERKMSYMLKMSQWEKKEKDMKKNEESLKKVVQEAQLLEKKKKGREKNKGRKKYGKREKAKEREEEMEKEWEAEIGAEREAKIEAQKEADIEAQKEAEIEAQKEAEIEAELEAEIEAEKEAEREAERATKGSSPMAEEESERENYTNTNEFRSLCSFDEKLDLNQIYTRTSNYDEENEPKKKTIKIHTYRMENNGSTSTYSKEMCTDKNEDNDETNIARYLYSKTYKRETGKKNYNYDEPHYGKDMNNISYKEIKKSDLFKGFVEPSAKTKKKILIVKKEQ
ncbi:double C2-like domain-containing protein, putative [Plasmodium malariae]|uniref:Double C2-like domain-containing protein, putative n=1 Tax=Plasmodium malariae TaxID=5858 RepID=A0A1D3TFL9_PLAMA|nr:double C2-like domain-containing protein, putative [Plasmodium malariae]SCP03711.1 double C2-like domain-containing protein, putative [Plasmodium malariae]